MWLLFLQYYIQKTIPEYLAHAGLALCKTEPLKLSTDSYIIVSSFLNA